VYKNLLLLIAFVRTQSWGQIAAFISGEACQDIGGDRLKIRRQGLFGAKGTVIAVPRDQEIFTRFKSYGAWCPNVSLFLSQSFRKQGMLLLDLGAHAGLISLQTQKFSSNTQNPIVCVEPIPRHIDSLRLNVANLNCEIIPKVLSFDNDDVSFYIDEFNFGNSSALRAVAGKTNVHELKLSSITAQQIESIVGMAPIVLKSDLQGFDAYGLSLFSDIFWSKVERGVVEVLAEPEIDESHAKLTSSRIGKFRNISWSPFGKNRINESELLEFWTSKSGQERDVYFWN
jgi:FkbM family methyltransferase